VDYWGTADTVPEPIKIYGPLERADLPGLYARVCQALGAAAGQTIACDVAGIAGDAVAVEALCRLQLGARHWRCRVKLRNAEKGLLDIVAFMGLGDVIRPELRLELQR
jgi:ABC-type transporter Mla MlaB component